MLQEAEPVNGVLSVIRQLGVGAGPDGDASPNVLADMLPKAALNLAAKGLESFASGSSEISPPMSQNSSKLQELVNSLVGKWDMEFVTCFKIDQNEVIYVDVMERSGKHIFVMML